MPLSWRGSRVDKHMEVTHWPDWPSHPSTQSVWARPEVDVSTFTKFSTFTAMVSSSATSHLSPTVCRPFWDHADLYSGPHRHLAEQQVHPIPTVPEQSTSWPTWRYPTTNPRFRTQPTSGNKTNSKTSCTRNTTASSTFARDAGSSVHFARYGTPGTTCYPWFHLRTSRIGNVTTTSFATRASWPPTKPTSSTQVAGSLLKTWIHSHNNPCHNYHKALPTFGKRRRDHKPYNRLTEKGTWSGNLLSGAWHCLQQQHKHTMPMCSMLGTPTENVGVAHHLPTHTATNLKHHTLTQWQNWRNLQPRSGRSESDTVAKNFNPAHGRHFSMPSGRERRHRTQLPAKSTSDTSPVNNVSSFQSGQPTLHLRLKIQEVHPVIFSSCIGSVFEKLWTVGTALSCSAKHLCAVAIRNAVDRP